MFREIFHNLTFGHRMVIYRLLIALFLAGMIYYIFFVPKEGDRAMLRAAAAMKKAQSWKIESSQDSPQNSTHMHVLSEVQCPSYSRTTTTQSQVINGQPAEWTLVSLTIGQQSWMYTSSADKWMTAQTYGGGPKSMCEAMARGEPPSSLPPFDKWARRAFASKGERKDLGSSSCQQWNVSLPRHNLAPELFSVCINDDDQLPRLYTASGVESRIFDWNVPIDFSPPLPANP